MDKVIAPAKGAQVPKVGRCQQRLGKKPKFVAFFFEAFPNCGMLFENVKKTVILSQAYQRLILAISHRNLRHI